MGHTGEIAGTIEVGADSSSPYTVGVTVTDPAGAFAATTFWWSVGSAPVDVVAVEIEVVAPCIFNNGFGVIPVVIYGNDLVAGADIDISTVELEGMRVQRLWHWYLGVVDDFDHDGFDDLLVLIDDQAGTIPPAATTATLTGALTDGTAIEGTDDITRCRSWLW